MIRMRNAGGMIGVGPGMEAVPVAYPMVQVVDRRAPNLQLVVTKIPTAKAIMGTV